MGGEQATGTLLDITVKSLEREGHAVDADELGQLRDARGQAITIDRRTSATPLPAAGSTRFSIRPKPATTLISALEIATRHAEPEPFRLGVFQV